MLCVLTVLIHMMKYVMISKNWWPKLKPDGIMIGDDYNWKSVNQAVKDTFKEMKVSKKIWMNQSTEYTWYVSKNGNAEPYKKAIPK
jgi:hypothetical protein